MDEKMSGSYYTPHKTITFMRRYLSEQNIQYNTILEPCAGDGRFVDEFNGSNSIKSIIAIELYLEKTKLLLEKKYPKKVSIVTSDFLDYSQKYNRKFNLIIGNPPYINIKNMDKDFLEKARNLCSLYQLAENVVQNSWVAFVLASIRMLDKKGAIFFVLPLEFLQVQYAEQLREVLEKQFNTIHILTFKERMFPEIEQEACLVYLTNQEHELSYISYKQFEKLDSSFAITESKIERNKPLKKWSNAILSDSDIDVLKSTGERYTLINDICQSSPGIVTAANDKFILTEAEVQKYKCEHLVIPIIAKGAMVRNCFLIDKKLIQSLSSSGKKVYLLNLSEVTEEDLPIELRDYLDNVGNTERNGKKIKEGYKCSKRKLWYGVPIIKSGNALFFKRYDVYPRLCVNPQEIHTTDIAYNIRLNNNYEAESFVFCFYNSLTLAQCEFVGRYYAGGVSELIPSEFRSLPIPYRTIDKTDIDLLRDMFIENRPLKDIVGFVNLKTIAQDLGANEICKLDKIRLQLIGRRKSSMKDL